MARFRRSVGDIREMGVNAAGSIGRWAGMDWWMAAWEQAVNNNRATIMRIRDLREQQVASYNAREGAGALRGRCAWQTTSLRLASQARHQSVARDNNLALQN